MWPTNAGAFDRGRWPSLQWLSLIYTNHANEVFYFMYQNNLLFRYKRHKGNNLLSQLQA